MKKLVYILLFVLFVTPLKAQTTTTSNIKAPQIDIPTCLYTGNIFTFTDNDNSDPYLTWIWHIGNDIIEDDNILAYEFTNYGYYSVYVEVGTEECGFVLSPAEIIFVNPDICSCHDNEEEEGLIHYDYPYGHNIDFEDEIWETSTPNVYETLRVRGDVVISANRTLTIGEYMRVEFAPNGRIIVMPGAFLFIKSNVTLTSVNSETCGNNMWQGIEVWGNFYDAQNPLAQGFVVIENTNDVIIENAHIGILSGARNMNFLHKNPFDTHKGNGLIFIKGKTALFRNNGIGIKLNPRPFIAEEGGYWSGHTIENCDFITEGILPDHNYSTASSSPYPNQQNRWAGYANPYQRTDVGLYINGIRGLYIEDCDFEDMQYGISSIDAKYNVYLCDFLNSVFGISIFNTSTPIVNNHEIHECTFDLIPNNHTVSSLSVNPWFMATIPHPPLLLLIPGAQIKITGGMFDFIHDNTFGVLTTNQNLNDVGVRLTNASGFRIIENEFYKLKCGVNISESGNEDGEGGYVGAGLSTTHLNWTGNVYTQCRTNILTSGLNDNLKLKCNMCLNEYNNLFDVNFESSGTLANQGSLPYGTVMVPNNKRKFAAGNEFDGSYDPLNPTEPYYKEINSSTNYEYFHHTEPFMAIPVPTTTQITKHSIGYTKESNEISCPKPFLGAIVIDIDIIDDVPVDFDDSFDFTSTITSFNTTIESLEYDYNELELSLDKGNTLRLLSDIYNGAPQGKLKNDLISSSPLSDTVITALIIEYPLSHGNFKNVMQYNLPVSRDVSPYLNERLKTIPKGIANQLVPLMSENKFAVTPASIQRKIEFLNLEKQLYINEIIFRLLDTSINNKAAVVSLLNNIDTWSAKQLLFSDMLNNGEYSQAASFLADFDRSNSEINDWVELNEILLSLYSNDKTLYEMDSTQLAFVTDLAYKCPSKRGSARARSIIHMLFGEEVPPCVEMQSRNSKLMIRDVDFVKPDCDAYMEDNFPDPFTDYTLINYYLPEEMTGKIVVNDMFGRVIAEYQLEVGENTLEIINNNWAPGVYSYGMIVNDQAIEFKKMVITQ